IGHTLGLGSLDYESLSGGNVTVRALPGRSSISGWRMPSTLNPGRTDFGRHNASFIRLCQIHIHRLHLRIKFQGIFTELAALTAHFVAAERSGRVKDVIAVDPNGAGPQTVGQAMGLGNVPRPNGRGQAVKRLI